MATYYVDYANGDNTKAGTTTATAFKTLDKAQTVAVGGDTIYLRGGLQYLTSKLTFSNLNGISILPYSNEVPVITSRVNVSGWTIYDQSKNIWRASAQSANSLDLIVNNKRSYLSYYDLGNTSGWGTDSTGFSSTGGAGNGWANPTKMFLGFFDPTQAAYAWTESLMPVTSITATRINVDTTAKSYWDFNVNLGANPNPTFLINSLEGLLATVIPGMHYVDTVNNFVYYRPRADEDMTSVESWLPTVDETLVKFSNCQNVVFSVTVADTTSLRPQKTGGYIENQSGYSIALPSTTLDFNAFGVLGGMLEFDSCTTVNLTGMKLLHAGATGLWCHNGTTAVTGTGAVIYDSGATGIMFGQYSESNLGTPSGSSTISECFISMSGQKYPGGSHFTEMFCTNITVTECEMSYNYYSGMQFIGGWTTLATVTSGGHTISKVRILEFDTDTILRGNRGALTDTGGIYFNGKQDTTTVDRMYITRNQRPASSNPIGNICAGIYLDNHCSGVVATNFVIDGDAFSKAVNENDNAVTPYNTMDKIYYKTGLTNNITNTTVTNIHTSSSPTTDTSGSPTAPAIITAANIQSPYTGIAFARIPMTPLQVDGHWNFNSAYISGSTLYDISGNERHLTLSGSPTYGTSATGKMRYILGGNAALGAPIVTSGFAYKELLVSYNPTVLPTHQILAYNGDLNGNGEGIIIAASGTFNPGSNLQIYAAGVAFDLVGSSFTFTQGTWTHVGMVRYPNTTWYSYINGALDTTGSTTSPNGPETVDFQIQGQGNNDVKMTNLWVVTAMRQIERDYIYQLDGTVPSVPYFLTATPGVSSVTISCERAFNATGWKLYRSTDNISFSQIGGTSSSPTITDSTAVAGTKYYYAIVANNGRGDSATQSASVAATPLAPAVTNNSGAFFLLMNQ